MNDKLWEAEERRRQDEAEEIKRYAEMEAQFKTKEMVGYAASLCSGILLLDTCFLMDLGEVFFSVHGYREKMSDRTELTKEFVQLFEEQCQKHSFKITIHRHVYQEIQRLYNGEDRERSKKAQNAKKLIERWQKLGIVQTYPDLEDAEKSYYADDALLKYMGELLQKGEKVRLLTNDLDLRIRARDRFEKRRIILSCDTLLSLKEIMDKWDW